MQRAAAVRNTDVVGNQNKPVPFDPFLGNLRHTNKVKLLPSSRFSRAPGNGGSSIPQEAFEQAALRARLTKTR